MCACVCACVRVCVDDDSASMKNLTRAQGSLRERSSGSSDNAAREGLGGKPREQRCGVALFLGFDRTFAGRGLPPDTSSGDPMIHRHGSMGCPVLERKGESGAKDFTSHV